MAFDEDSSVGEFWERGETVVRMGRFLWLCSHQNMMLQGDKKGG